MTLADIIELFEHGACHVPEHTAKAIVRTLLDVEAELALPGTHDLEELWQRTK